MDLRHANLDGANLTEANLSGANLHGANLHGAVLSEATLSRADLSEATLTGAVLSVANLSGANLTGANLHGADLSEANLHGVVLTGANLSEATLSRAVLSEAVLTGAVLTGANLSGANLSVANLHGAVLSVANLHGVILTGANLSEAILFHANLTEANLSGANLTRADLKLARFIRSDLSDCWIEDAVVEDTQFDDLSGLPRPPSRLRLSPHDKPTVLTGHEAETFFTLPAVVEVFLTQVLTPEEIAGYHLHFADVLRHHAAPGVTDVGHRTEAGGTVLRFQGPNYPAIYAALPDLLVPFRQAVSVDWEKSLAALPPDERVEAVVELVKREAGVAKRRWELAERLADVFAGIRNARVCRLSEGRSRGLRIDLFTNEEMAARLDRANSPAPPPPLVFIAGPNGTFNLGDNTNMGDTFQNTGNIIGSAVGREATTVTSGQIIATLVQRAYAAPPGDDLAAKLKEALRHLGAEKVPEKDKKDAAEDVGKVQQEMGEVAPDPGRVRRLLGQIVGISKSVAETLSSAKAITDLLRGGGGA